MTEHSLARFLLCLFFLGPKLASASRFISQDEVCFSGVMGAIADLQFEGIGYGDYYMAACRNPLEVASLYCGLDFFCNPAQQKAGLKSWETMCVQYGPGSVLSRDVVAENTTEKAVKKMHVVTSLTEAIRNFTAPVMISEAVYAVSFRTVDDWNWEQIYHYWYSLAMYGFWAGVVLIGMGHRVYNLLRLRRSASLANSSQDAAEAGVKAGPTTWLSTSVRRHITLPSILPPYHTRSMYGCTIPTRLEFLVVYLYWAVSLTLCCVNYRGFKGNLYYADIAPQTWRYLADRTGIISYANLAILWMFSGRNNILIWLTGWQFSVFNVFHKHVARIATIQAIVHSIGYTAFYDTSGSWESYLVEWEEVWWWTGAMATVSMSFLVFFSFSFFRKRTYEIFLLLHILLSIVTIVGLFNHTWVFETKEYDPYLWPVVAIWAFDRFVRIVRLVYCNIHVCRGSGKTVHRTTATVVHHPAADLIEIKVTPATGQLMPGPGQHWYLYQPFKLTGWENHPFTLAAYDRPESLSGDLTLSFYARPQNGWTSKLRKQCEAAGGGTLHTTLLVEGPYGLSEPLWDFDEVLLIAGGSGIAAIIPYLREHINRTNGSGPIRTKVVHLVWADRHEESFTLIMNGPLAAVAGREDVILMLHITSTSGNMSPRSNTSTDEKCAEPTSPLYTDAAGKDDGHALAPVFEHGRPDIKAIISSTATEVSSRGLRLAVLACGPAGLADAARDATRLSMQSGKDNVRYYEEAFGW